MLLAETISRCVADGADDYRQRSIDQFLLEFHDEDPDHRADLLRDEPPPTGDRHLDVLAAVLAEMLARRWQDHPPPRWCFLDGCDPNRDGMRADLGRGLACFREPFRGEVELPVLDGYLSTGLGEVPGHPDYRIIALMGGCPSGADARFAKIAISTLAEIRCPRPRVSLVPLAMPGQAIFGPPIPERVLEAVLAFLRRHRFALMLHWCYPHTMDSFRLIRRTSDQPR